jgi:hypothetical protein
MYFEKEIKDGKHFENHRHCMQCLKKPSSICLFFHIEDGM